jgi:hypothetical protein
VPHAQVEGVLEEVLPVRPHVQLHGQGLVGAHAPHGGVKGELADADGHAPVALVPDAQNGGGVRGHDKAHLLQRHVPQGFFHLVNVLGADGEAPGVAVDVGELPHRLPHRGRVEDGEHLLQVVHQEGVEEDLVPVLEVPQVDVLLQRRGLQAVAAVDPLLLLLQGVDVGRKKAKEAQGPSLLLGEGRALVEEGKPEEEEARDVGLQVPLPLLVPLDVVVAADRHALTLKGKGGRLSPPSPGRA